MWIQNLKLQTLHLQKQLKTTFIFLFLEWINNNCPTGPKILKNRSTIFPSKLYLLLSSTVKPAGFPLQSFTYSRVMLNNYSMTLTLRTSILRPLSDEGPSGICRACTNASVNCCTTGKINALAAPYTGGSVNTTVILQQTCKTFHKHWFKRKPKHTISSVVFFEKWSLSK